MKSNMTCFRECIRLFVLLFSCYRYRVSLKSRIMCTSNPQHVKDILHQLVQKILVAAEMTHSPLVFICWALQILWHILALFLCFCLPQKGYKYLTVNLIEIGIIKDEKHCRNTDCIFWSINRFLGYSRSFPLSAFRLLEPGWYSQISWLRSIFHCLTALSWGI